MIRRFLKDTWLILHEAFQFYFVEEVAYHSLHQNKNKCQNTVRGCRETGEPLWFLEICVLPGVALVEEILRNLWGARTFHRAGCFAGTFATFVTWPKAWTGCRVNCWKMRNLWAGWTVNNLKNRTRCTFLRHRILNCSSTIDLLPELPEMGWNVIARSHALKD